MAVMMGGPGFRTIACVMIMWLLIVAPHVGAVFNCRTLSGPLSTCRNYLVQGGSIPRNCCQAVVNFRNAVKTPGDRQNACKCLQNTVGVFQGVKPSFLDSLPSKCGVHFSYNIDWIQAGKGWGC